MAKSTTRAVPRRRWAIACNRARCCAMAAAIPRLKSAHLISGKWSSSLVRNNLARVTQSSSFLMSSGAVVFPPQLSEEAITSFAPVLPPLDESRMTPALAQSAAELCKRLTTASCEVQILMRTIREIWTEWSRLPVMPSQSSSKPCSTRLLRYYSLHHIFCILLLHTFKCFLFSPDLTSPPCFPSRRSRCSTNRRLRQICGSRCCSS